jgi:hypothetical protein
MTDGRGAGRGGPCEAAAVSARVFISYAHDDPGHEERVRGFWWFLREQGIDARVDLPAAECRQDWAEWMTRQVHDAVHVLVIASPEYRRRAEGDAGPGEGRGVQWEARLIRDRFYADQKTGLQVVIPVVLPGCSADDIPLWMAPASTTHYLVSEYTVAGAEALLRLLTGQPWQTEPLLGMPPVLPQRGPGTDHRRYQRLNVPGRPVRLLPRPVYLAGRDQLLADLHARLTADDCGGPRIVALTGLGGIGKTSAAVEYAHRHMAEYGLVWQFPADQSAVLLAGFAQLANQLGARDVPGVTDPVAQVHSTLAISDGGWLLVFDNVADPAAIWKVLPPVGRGHVLITSQNAHWPAAQAMDVPVLARDVAAAFLTGRSARADRVAAFDLADELGGLPLALEQAAAYMQASGRGIAEYLALFRERRAELLTRGIPTGYDKRVATTWTLAFEQLQRSSPGSIGLLRLLSCYAPEAIPIAVLLRPLPRGKAGLSPEVARSLVPLLEDTLAVDDAVADLRRYSLIGPPVDGSVSVHRLVQAVTLDQMPAELGLSWRIAASILIAAALPTDPSLPEAWPRYAALLPHAQAIPGSEMILGQFSAYLYASGSYTAACVLQRQIADARQSGLGSEDRATLAARANLAIFIGVTGDAAEARKQFTELVPVCVRVLGAEHRDTLAVRSQLARWTGEAGDPAEARDQLAQLLAVRERVLGVEHPDILTDRGNLAGWIGITRDPAEARDQFTVLVSACERVLGAEHPRTLTNRVNLAMFTGTAGDPAGARDQFTQLLAVRERVLGAEHPDTLTDRANLAFFTGMAGDPAGARDQFSQLIAVRERVLGAEHPQTLIARLTVAPFVESAGDPAAARDQLASLLPICQRVLGAEHPETLEGRANLAWFTAIAGDEAAARDQFIALLPVRERVFGAEHPHTLADHARLASLTGRTGDAVGARDRFAALAPICERVLGPMHPHTKVAHLNLATWRKAAARNHQ